MANLLIRNVPDNVMEMLKGRARKHQRSLQQEVLYILKQQSSETLEDILEQIVKRSRKWEKMNRQFSDSTLLVREDREQ